MSFSEWTKYKLEDALEVIIDYRGKTPRKTTFGIPLITAKIVKNGFIQEPDEFLAEEDYASWMVRGLPEIGDVVLTTEAPLGEVAQIKNKRVALAQRIVTLRGKKDTLDNGFLKYFLQSATGQSRLKEKETGTTVTGIKQSELRTVEIDCPSIETQRRIADILSALDDKIELNRQTNATLEAMAQAIFKEWFVDFNYPGASSDLVDSELGLIPARWRVYRLEELIESVSITHKFNNEQIIFLNTSDVEEGRVLHHDYRPIAGLPGQAKKSIRKFDILFTEIRPANKRFSLIDFDAEDYVVSTKLMVLRTKAHIQPIVIYNFITSQEILSHLQMLAESRSGTFPQITFDQVKELQIVLPTDELLEKYTDFIWSIFHKIKCNEQQNISLAQTRNDLLPKLMHGEIEV